MKKTLTMKTLISVTLALGVLASPVLSFAQEAAPLTRAEVRADLVRVEQAGYYPRANDLDYPADIQAAEAKIAAEDANHLTNNSVGGTALNGTGQSGSIQPVAPLASATTTQSLYDHH